MLRISNIIINVKRHCSQTPKFILQCLKDRALIKTSGHDVSEFLQGLMTNDIRHLDSFPGSLYTMFLNVKGRVLYDSIIYKTNEPNTYFLECDKNISGNLQKHLKMYRVKRKIDISDVSDDYRIFALFRPDWDITSAINLQHVEGRIVPCNVIKESLPDNSSSTKFFKDIIVFRDPRLINLGSRIISKPKINTLEQVKELNSSYCISEEEAYRSFRYKMGVPEGVLDLPTGNCFPLECNCDYLHGVSFHKGCYIGQELTARTYHTGVIRKRLMPLYFEKVPTKLPENSAIIVDKNNLGKLRGVEGQYGLALLRVAKVLEMKTIPIGNGSGIALRPNWWPVEAPKEKIQQRE